MYRYVECSAHKPTERTVISIDMRNAFNTMSRSHILAIIRNALPDLACIADMILTREQYHYYYDHNHDAHKITASTRVDQGDPPSGPMFMIGMAPLTRKINTSTPNPITTESAAYADDLYATWPHIALTR